MGIPEEDQEKIIEPFFSTKPSGEGTGLGLSITYGIMKDHQGSLSFESQLGEFTKVILEFPIAPSIESNSGTN